jgi:hypothetical protein
VARVRGMQQQKLPGEEEGGGGELGRHGQAYLGETGEWARADGQGGWVGSARPRSVWPLRRGRVDRHMAARLRPVSSQLVHVRLIG